MISGGAAWKLDALAETLTFHAVGELTVRGREAVQWLATADVRVPEGPVRGRGAPEGGIDAHFVIARMVDYASGEPLDTRYLLCDPQLSVRAPHVARWSLWADNAETQFRTLRHALDHFAQDGEGASAAGAGLAALQLGLTALRLEHAPTATAPAFLARLAGRTGTRQPGNAAVPGAVLNEGMGRLLALLDVLESYPGRPAAETVEPMDLAVQAHVDVATGLPQLMAPGVAS